MKFSVVQLSAETRSANMQKVDTINLAYGTPPLGYKLIHQRKFVVMRRAADLILVIGPNFKPRLYFHERLIKHGKPWVGNCTISGGGWMDGECQAKESLFTGGDPVLQTPVHFHGKSKDFGVYDPAILDPIVRHKTTMLLGCHRISHDWSGKSWSR
jgi:hypothetical protein